MMTVVNGVLFKHTWRKVARKWFKKTTKQPNKMLFQLSSPLGGHSSGAIAVATFVQQQAFTPKLLSKG